MTDDVPGPDEAVVDPADLARESGLDPARTVDPARRTRSGQAGFARRSVSYLVPVSSDAGGVDRPGPGAASAPPDDEADLTPAGELGGEPPDEPAEREDWAWVQEWRAGREPTPWATGIPLVVFSALVVGVAVWVLSAGLADRPVVAILVNLLVAAGLAPAIWLSRGLPVLRWVAAGAAAGIVIGWVSAVLMLPYPSP